MRLDNLIIYLLWIVIAILSTSVMAYHPSQVVRSAHYIPHLTSSLQPTSNQFSLTTGYIQSLIPFSAILLGLGVFSVLLFIILMILRCCCSCLRCIPKQSDFNDLESQVSSQEVAQDYLQNDDLSKHWRSRIVRSRRMWYGGFLLALLTAILANHSLFIGNSYFSQGIHKESTAVKQVEEIFQQVDSISLTIQSDMSSIESLVQLSVCVQETDSLSDIDSAVNDVDSALSSLDSSIESVISALQSFRHLMDYYGVTVKNEIVFSFYAVIMVILFSYLLSTCLRSVWLAKLTMFITLFIVLGLTLLCALETILVAIIGDICIDPSGNLATAFPKGYARNVLEYYTECEGSNPIGYYISNTTFYVDYINTLIDDLTVGPYAPCPDDYYLNQTKPYIDNAVNEVDLLVDLTDCQTVYNIWDTAVNEGFCGYLMNGLFSFWISEYILSGSLFFLLCFMSLLYNYYGRYWRIKVSSAADDKLSLATEDDGEGGYDGHRSNSCSCIGIFCFCCYSNGTSVGVNDRQRRFQHTRGLNSRVIVDSHDLDQGGNQDSDRAVRISPSQPLQISGIELQDRNISPNNIRTSIHDSHDNIILAHEVVHANQQQSQQSNQNNNHDID